MSSTRRHSFRFIGLLGHASQKQLGTACIRDQSSLSGGMVFHFCVRGAAGAGVQM